MTPELKFCSLCNNKISSNSFCKNSFNELVKRPKRRKSVEYQDKCHIFPFNYQYFRRRVQLAALLLLDSHWPGYHCCISFICKNRLPPLRVMFRLYHLRNVHITKTSFWRRYTENYFSFKCCYNDQFNSENNSKFKRIK